MNRLSHVHMMQKRQRAIDSMINDSVDAPPEITIGKIVSMDNRVYDLLERARKTKSGKARAYLAFRKELQQLVGWTAQNKTLQLSDAYAVAHRVLCDALR